MQCIWLPDKSPQSADVKGDKVPGRTTQIKGIGENVGTLQMRQIDSSMNKIAIFPLFFA